MARNISKGGNLRRRGRWRWLAAAGLAMTMTPHMAAAQDSPFALQIPAQPLDAALLALSRQADVNIAAPTSLTARRTSRPISGVMPPEEALTRILEGSGLTFNRTGARSFAIVPFVSADRDAQESEEGAILVTGSRIRGAAPMSPVTTVTQEEMRSAGQSDLGEVVRSLPQNFSGGQNPGTGTGAEAFGSYNLGGTSNINLRGLGSGATLTLLNGRRLAYGGINQGVDISAIPLGAVERIEIVADGASALYGSDAVGGVANVILKRGWDGIEANAQIGAATEGGYFRRQVSGALGRSWGSGNVLVAGGIDRWSDITAGQRSYTSATHPSATIYPGSRSGRILGSARQDLSPNLNFSVDALYSSRSTSASGPSNAATPATVAGSLRDVDTSSYVVSPIIEFDTPGGWRSALSATHGRDHTDQFNIFTSGGVEIQRAELDYTNRTTVIEANAEGPLFQLWAAPARLAIGGGYRAVALDRFTKINAGAGVTDEWSQDSRYAYGELFVPIVSPAQGLGGINQLSVTAALRYEDYAQVGDVFTPKVGITYSPTQDWSLRASWGRSFRTPTLFDLNGSTLGSATLPSRHGGVGFPADATVIFLAGANTSLQPEHSTNWTVSGAVHPASISGLRIEAAYFEIDYRDRIAEAVVGSQALANPLYAPFITFNPSNEQIDAAISSANAGFNNLTGRPSFDRSTVVAIIDARLRNVSRQRANGVDVAAIYQADLGESDTLSFSLSGTYLRLRNRLTPDTASIAASGVLFNPPHWRVRGGMNWESGRVSVSTFANYTGPLEDVRPASPNDGIDAQVTIDASAALRIPLDDPERRLTIRVSALNLLNARPERIWVSNPVLTPFDSVNYSAIGRQVSLSVGVNW